MHAISKTKTNHFYLWIQRSYELGAEKIGEPNRDFHV